MDRSATMRRLAGALVFVLALALIAQLTLTAGPGGRRHAIRWELSFDEVHLVQDILNVALFAPLGVAAWLLGLSLSRAFLLGAGLSLGIEALQHLVVPGRYAELADLLANTLGTLLGWLVARELGTPQRD